jgi:antitoxin ParD1/3/4
MVTMNISLPKQMKAYAEAQAKDGRFSNVSDYMRDLIRRDQTRQAAVAELQGLIDEGIASGPALPFDMGDFVARARARSAG